MMNCENVITGERKKVNIETLKDIKKTAMEKWRSYGMRCIPFYDYAEKELKKVGVSDSGWLYSLTNLMIEKIEVY